MSKPIVVTLMEVPPRTATKLIACRKNRDGSIPLGHFAVDINDAGEVVGGFADTHGDHAPLLKRGIYTAFDFSGAVKLMVSRFPLGLSS